MDGYEWDPAKAAANLKKHKVRFADAALSLEDPRALVVTDPDASGEERFICLGADPEGRVLVTVVPIAVKTFASFRLDGPVSRNVGGTTSPNAKTVRFLEGKAWASSARAEGQDANYDSHRR